jgi:hypothetical protein
MKRLLLILLLLGGTLAASQPKSNLTIVSEGTFYDGFWETPAGLAFWQTSEGKTVLQMMLDYKNRMQSQ